MRDAIAEANRQRKLFSAQVILNLDCNLACSYCYEGGLKGRHYMAPPKRRNSWSEVVERDHISKGQGCPT